MSSNSEFFRHCEICNVKVYSEDTWVKHVSGKKHVKLKGAWEQQQQVAERSVHVQGFPRYTCEAALADAFASCGTVAAVNIVTQGMYAFVEFTAVEGAKAALAANVALYGKALRVKPKMCRKREAPGSRKEGRKKHREGGGSDGEGVEGQSEVELVQRALLEQLQTQASVEDQMRRVQSFLQLTPDDLHHRELFRRLLQETCGAIFPGCEVQLFGSSTNGFGALHSDVDVHIRLPAQAGDERRDAAAVPAASSGATDGSEEDAPLVSREDVERASDLDLLQMVRQVLVGVVKGLELRLVPSARCPVLAFSYPSGSLRGDISLRNSISMQNSLLLAFLSDLDSCVKPLVFTLRNWVKTWGLSGSAGGFSSYTVTFYVIAYLQRLRMLPTVEQLMDLAGPPERRSEQGWECGFSTDVSSLELQHNSSLEDLLRGCLEFVRDCLGSDVVLCLRTGRIVDLAQFARDAHTRPLWSNFKVSHVNVQDPFRRDHNIAASVSEEVRLSLAAKITAVLTGMKNPEFSSPSSDNPWGVMRFLGDVVSSVRTPSTSVVKGIPQTSSGSSKPESDLSLFLRLNPQFKHEDVFGYAVKNDCSFLQAWYIGAAKFVRNVFSEGLLFSCTDVKADVTETCKVDSQKSNVAPASGSLGKSGESDCDLGTAVNTDDCRTNCVAVDSSKADTPGEEDMKERVGMEDRANHVAPVETCSSAETGNCGSFKQRSETSLLPNEDHDASTDNSLPTGVSSSSTYTPRLGSKCFTCQAFHRTWAARRSVQKTLPRPLPDCPLSLAQAVSHAIVSDAESSELLLEFDVRLQMLARGPDTGMLVEFFPVTGEEEFRNYVYGPFLAPFFLKLFNTSCT